MADFFVILTEQGNDVSSMEKLAGSCLASFQDSMQLGKKLKSKSHLGLFSNQTTFEVWTSRETEY